MTMREKCEAAAAALNVTLEIDTGRRFEVIAVAPAGWEFAASPGLTELVSSKWDDQSPDDVWADVLYRLAYGLM